MNLEELVKIYRLCPHEKPAGCSTAKRETCKLDEVLLETDEFVYGACDFFDFIEELISSRRPQ